MDGHGSTKLRAAAAEASASASGSRVPDDALVEMLELLPAKSLHRFKCVSKAWCALLTDPFHRPRFAQTLAGFLCSDAGLCKCCRRADRRISITRRRRFVNVSGMAAPLVDATFPFLPPRPSGEGFRDVILDARDGLVLLARFRGHGGDSPGLHPPPACYLVCNPATARWAFVPPPPSSSSQKMLSRTYLLFDAAGDSPHAFHLLQFRLDDLDAVRAVHTYSSATNTWTDRAAAWRDGGWRDWGGVAMAPIQPCTGAAVANGFLHLAVDTDGTCASGPNNNLVAVDEEGNTRRTIPLPRREVAEKDWHSVSVFVAKSQGRLHYLMCVHPPHGWLSEEHPLKLLVWVLEDYGSGEWVLKHTVGFPELFDGRVACQFRVDYSVVAVHPDGNWVFFVRHWDRKLVAYDMDRREVIVVADLGELGVGDELPTPYVPLYAECAALTNKQ